MPPVAAEDMLSNAPWEGVPLAAAAGFNPPRQQGLEAAAAGVLAL